VAFKEDGEKEDDIDVLIYKSSHGGEEELICLDARGEQLQLERHLLLRIESSNGRWQQCISNESAKKYKLKEKA
jgi:hypothetical protein